MAHVAKLLVRTVARAFYPDPYVVVLDALCRHKYLLDSEASGRSPLESLLKLQSKQVRTILKDLYREGLVHQKTLLYRDYNASLQHGKALRSIKRVFWYINYRHFVQLVRLRVSLMMKEISGVEAESAATKDMFVCPNCSNTYTMIDAQRSLDLETRKFYCEKCFDQYGDKVFLVEQNAKALPGMGSTAGRFKSLSDKRREQLSEVKSIGREGIMELLLRLKELHVPENNPEQHMKKDSEQYEEIVERRKNGQEAGNVVSSKMSHLYSGAAGQQVVVDIDDGKEAKQQEEQTATTQLPVWMQRDVTGAMASSALEDAADRASKRSRIDPKAGMSTSRSSDLGGASALLEARKRGDTDTVKSPDVDAKIEHEVEADGGEEKFVTVQGEKIALKHVKEAHTDKMTKEEYELYAAMLNEEDDDDDF